MKTSYSTIGVMAGSSMDGLDLALISFELTEDGWKYTLKKSETRPYDESLSDKLKESPNESKTHQLELDLEFGYWIANAINDFKDDDAVELLAVHGHTVVHDPNAGISWQLGRGDIIANETKITTVSDFRSQDIQLGGQGAPLVPFGDFILFKEYDACLNLGGIANISLQQNQSAWDVCPCNQVLNYFAHQLGHPYDENGDLARQGKWNQSLYDEIIQLKYFQDAPPKSLPNQFIPIDILEKSDPLDGLFTYSKIIAQLIGSSVPENGSGQMLLTGGGAFNDFLTHEIEKSMDNWKLTIPDATLINFKESLIFAFLAIMKVREEINVLGSVTGASSDSSSGVIHLPND